uniref:Sialin n=1 Tax=Periophthalmus magnuspinnatus TaxID=409849 RepID=A0A3B4BJG7_9GOBI
MSCSTESIDTAPPVDEDDCEPLVPSKTVPPRCCSARLNLAVLMFLGLTVVYGLRVNLNVAMVAMVNNTNPPPATNSSNSSKHMCPLPGTNHTRTGFSQPDGAPVYSWDTETQGWLLGALFFGYLCTLIPGGYLAGHYGGTKFLGFGVLGTAALTLVTPLAAQWGPSWLFALRALEGFTQGVLHPSTMTIWARWAPPLERSRLMSFSGSGGIFGALLTLPLTSFICETLGWPAVFYLCGAGCVWAVFWFALVSDDPHTHKRISKEEREYIIKSIGPQGHGWTVPLRSMVTSLPLWAIIIGQICANWGFYTLLNSTTAYMSNILHYDLESNGILSALPYLGGWLLSSLSGVVADLLIERRVFSVTVTRKIFTALGNKNPVGCSHIWTVLFLTLSTTTGGACYAGVYMNLIDIAPRYSGFLLGVSLTFASISGAVAPIADSLDGWRRVFWLAAGIQTSGAVFYTIFSSGNLQKWAMTDEDRGEAEKRRTRSMCT